MYVSLWFYRLACISAEVTADTARAWNEYYNGPKKAPADSATPITDGGEVLDDEAEEEEEHQKDHPEWPGVDLEVRQLTDYSVMYDEDRHSDAPEPPIAAEHDAVVNLGDWE